jgi:hypothetical protein
MDQAVHLVNHARHSEFLTLPGLSLEFNDGGEFKLGNLILDCVDGEKSVAWHRLAAAGGPNQTADDGVAGSDGRNDDQARRKGARILGQGSD